MLSDAKDEYDNWFSNDCDLSPPTDIVIHASSYPAAGAVSFSPKH